MRDKLKLAEDDTLKYKSSRTRGFAGQTDITEYDILDAAGNLIGSVEFTEDVAVRGFRQTNTVVQRDAQGAVVVSTSWNPALEP
ncbi:hypothetical protein [uncultured Stenotrophomonas sp.]|uniref:hypothetical protein n=1 Tax=uncultured Stenotrophomonas sp. TaxID=165438 RepID=UPI0025D06E1D|nr:hypothetical protein [uncultured Stenotrophomonas sp.]